MSTASGGGKTRNGRASGILANTAYRAVADLVSKLCSAVLFVVMARKLGGEGFGVFTFALAFVTLVTSLGDFGQDAMLTREVSRNLARVHRYFTNTLALKVFLTLPTLAVALGIGLAAGFSRETAEVAALLGLGVLVDQLNLTCAAVFQSFERLAYLPVALISQRLFTAIAGVAALFGGAGVVSVAAIYLVGSVLGFAIAVWFLITKIVRPEVIVDRGMWWPLMRAAAPIGIAGIFGAVLARVDTTMLAAFKSATVVGNYGAAYRLFETTFFLSWGVGAAVYPVLARSALRTPERTASVFGRSLKLGVALTLPLAAGAVVLGPGVIRLLYGREFELAGPALQLLAPGIALFPISYIGGYLLVASDRQRTMSVVFGVVALENVLANFVLIPWLSLKGAALGNSISQAILVGLLVWLSVPIVGRLPWVRSLSGPVVATALSTVAMLLFRHSTGTAVAVGAAVYLLALLTLEQLAFPDDARALWTLLRTARAD
jgi:O-antigen/teichoic acid export membrane protein